MKFWEILHPGRGTRHQFVAARDAVLRKRLGTEEGLETRGPGPGMALPSPQPRVPNPYMEARGIEPRSENDSDTATTCVDEAFRVSPPRRLAGRGSNQPLETLA